MGRTANVIATIKVIDIAWPPFVDAQGGTEELTHSSTFVAEERLCALTVACQYLVPMEVVNELALAVFICGGAQAVPL